MVIQASMVILSYNRFDELSRNLPRLLSERHCPDEFEIIVVDNNSTDGSREFLIALQKEHPEIKLILNESNLGVAGGRNAGFAVAQREFVVALDDDAAIVAEDLRRVPSLFEEYPDAGVLAFRVIHPPSGEAQNPHGDVPCEVANHHGAGFAFRRSLYQMIGGIDEDCDFGAEELDFAIRIRVHGWKVLYTPEIPVYHNNFRRNPSLDQFRRIRRVYNNVRIYHKYFPRWMASRNSCRYVILAMRNWIAEYGLQGAGEIIKKALSGRKAGISKRQPVPDATTAFYNDSTLRPEFGNVPLLYKLIERLRLTL